MPKKICCDRKRVYVAGPLFNQAEREQQANIAKALERNGYCTFLPQRDGYAVGDLIDDLQKKGTTGSDAAAEATKIVFDFDLKQLRESDAIVVDANGIEPDSGTMIEAGMAYLLSVPVVIYYNDVRSFSPDLNLNPLLLGVTKVPIATSPDQVPRLVTKAIAKNKCSSCMRKRK